MERERENLFLFASQITIFFKKIKQRIVSNIAKNAANEKNTESNKTSEYNCKTKQQQYKSVMREVGRDNRHLITTPIRI